MNYVDLVEAVQAITANVISNFLGFISIVSAYLIVAFLAGKKLTRSQLIMINSLYMTVTFFLALGQYQLIVYSIYLSNEIVKVNPEWPGTSWDYGHLAATAVWVAIVLGSTKFMLDVRER